jgi:hypothetical protein
MIGFIFRRRLMSMQVFPLIRKQGFEYLQKVAPGEVPERRKEK